MLNLIKTQGNQNKVAELFAKLPGADANWWPSMAATGASSGGLSGHAGRRHDGWPTGRHDQALRSRSFHGPDQALGTITLDYAKEKAGDRTW